MEQSESCDSPGRIKNEIRGSGRQIPELNNTEELIAEANPHDIFWGTGHSIDETMNTEKGNWRGGNNLGLILSQVRGEYRSGAYKADDYAYH